MWMPIVTHQGTLIEENSGLRGRIRGTGEKGNICFFGALKGTGWISWLRGQSPCDVAQKRSTGLG